jgi:predicted dehydrogenase
MTGTRDPGIGFVGLGVMGTTHAENLDDAGASVVAGVDIDANAQSSFADTFDAATYEDHDEMLDAESLDAVVVTTPNRFHEPAAVSVLERDIHVLCEKPLAHTLDSAERIAGADRQSDAFCMVGFCNRFAQSARLYRQCRRRGDIGEVEHVEANYVRRRGIPGLGSWFTDEGLAGGGALMDIGVHAVDLALHLADYPDVVEVTGQTRCSIGTDGEYADPDGWANRWDTSGERLEVDDAASAFLRCANGVTISLEVAWATNRRSDKVVRVTGSEAGAELEMGGSELTLLEAGVGEVDYFDDRTLSGSVERDRHRIEDERFLAGVESDDRPTMNTVDEGVEVQRVVDAIYRAARTGTAVSVAETAPDHPSNASITSK